MNSSATSILVTWSALPEDDQNGIILGYNITYFIVDDELGATTSISETSTTINITGLAIYTEYNISVAAYTIIDTGPYDSIVVRTDSSGKQHNITIGHMSLYCFHSSYCSL